MPKGGKSYGNSSRRGQGQRKGGRPPLANGRHPQTQSRRGGRSKRGKG